MPLLTGREKEVKLSLLTPWGVWREWRYSRSGSYARHEMELNSVLYPRGMSLRYSLSRRRLGFQSSSGRFGEEKIYWCLHMNSGSSSPHPSHYINWGIPATTCTPWGLRIFTSVTPNILRLCSSLDVRNRVSHPYRAAREFSLQPCMEMSQWTAVERTQVRELCRNGVDPEDKWIRVEVWIRGGSHCEWCRVTVGAAQRLGRGRGCVRQSCKD